MVVDASDAPGENPSEPPVGGPDLAVPNHEERLWAMLAHLAGILGYIGGIGQYVVPLVIYLVYKDKSRFVAFHALQSLYFQLGVLVAGLGVLVIAMATCVGGLLFLPLSIGALAYAIVAGIRANQGEWFEYWLVGAWARQQILGPPGI
jgi:uncharacterized Tic20 family protein